MALVLALGSLGAAFAAWTDTVTLNGSVTTGTVDINVVGYSSTWVYKVPGAENEIEVIHHNLPTEPTVPANAVLMYPGHPNADENHPYAVAYAIAEPAKDEAGALIDDQVTVTYFNLFPSIDFIADILLHYEGSIPVKVNVANITSPDQWMLGLCEQYLPGDPAPPETGIWVVGYESTIDHTKGTHIPYAEGMQLHYCDYVLVEFIIHLPQDNDLMGLSGEFTATLEVVQWNEYPHCPQ